MRQDPSAFVIPAEAQVDTAVDDGRILVSVPVGYFDSHFLRRSRRGLVTGILHECGRTKAFGLDSRQARRNLARAAPGSHLVMPRAYLLDELTPGILWATANLDEGLLDDDRLPADCHKHLLGYEKLPRSAPGRDVAAGLTTVSQMWLGSDFCARHISTDDRRGLPRCRWIPGRTCRLAMAGGHPFRRPRSRECVATI